MYELNNTQRRYFGLDEIKSHWDRVAIEPSGHRPSSIIYFDEDIIKKQIISTDEGYLERAFNEPTRERKILLPKTQKGKEMKLSLANLEKKTPIGVYLNIGKYGLLIANYTSQTTFYSSDWESEWSDEYDVSKMVSDFIDSCPPSHLSEIEKFKLLERKNVKFKRGDYFRFKLDRSQYGFGRILLDIDKLRRSELLATPHGLLHFMGRPVLIELFIYASQSKDVSIERLLECRRLPSDVMLDNSLFYGEYEIFAHRQIDDDEYDFPLSFHISPAQTYLQWGFMQINMSEREFKKSASQKLNALIKDNSFRYSAIGFSPHYGNLEILKSLNDKDIYETQKFVIKQDLRNPKFKEAKDEIMRIFGLDPLSSYAMNARKFGVIMPSELKF